MAREPWYLHYGDLSAMSETWYYMDFGQLTQIGALNPISLLILSAPV